MSACEACWSAAQLRVWLAGGSVVDRYKEELTLHADKHAPGSLQEEGSPE